MVCKDPRSTVCCFWSILNTKFSTLAYFYGRVGSNFVRSQIHMGCSSSITKRWTCSCPFDVPKKKVQVCSMSNFVNLVKALLGSLIVRSKPKLWFLSWIPNTWTHLSSFNVQKMMCKFFGCSINWCLTHHYRMDKEMT